MSRVTKPVEERRQEIIDTAKELFIENGFDKTQMADISKKMNVAQGLVYHYFKSKTEILYAVVDIIAEERAATSGKILSEAKGTARDRLAVLFNAQTIREDYSDLIPIFISDSAVIEYCLRKMTVSALAQLVSLIESGNADGSWHFEYPETVAAFILHGISGLITTAAPVCREENEQQALLEIVLSIFKSSQ